MPGRRSPEPSQRRPPGVPRRRRRASRRRRSRRRSRSRSRRPVRFPRGRSRPPATRRSRSSTSPRTCDRSRRRSTCSRGTGSSCKRSRSLPTTSGSSRPARTGAASWDLAGPTRAKTLTGHDSAINCVSFTADGKHLLTACDDHAVRVFAVPSFELVRALDGHTDYVSRVFPAGDGRCASCSKDGTVRIWNLETGEQLHEIEHGGWVTALGTSHDGAGSRSRAPTATRSSSTPSRPACLRACCSTRRATTSARSWG